MILAFLGIGLFAGWVHWRHLREQGIVRYALFQRNDQRWPHCRVRVTPKGLWIQHGITLWTIPWAQVAEALSGPTWWGIRLQSGDFVGLYWEDPASPISDWWP